MIHSRRSAERKNQFAIGLTEKSDAGFVTGRRPEVRAFTHARGRKNRNIGNISSIFKPESSTTRLKVSLV
jgi:hypothetical protein